MKRSAVLAALLVVVAAVVSTGLQRPAPPPAASRAVAEPAVFPPDEAYIRAALPPGEERYARITGPHIKALIKELTAIAVKYRDEGHQYWGRITGMPSDAATIAWSEQQFKRVGLRNIWTQRFNLRPQWVPQSFEASVTGSGRTVALKSIFPIFGSAGTSAAGISVDPVWVGLGTAADYLGRDVRGKAVFIHSIPTPGGRNYSAQWNGAIDRAERSGAAAIVVMMGVPGNVMSQPGGEGGISPPGGTRSSIPHMTIGMQDGTVVREMIEQQVSPKIHLRMAVQEVPNLSTATVWGELPGNSDENIFLMAHTDGFFQGALDNAAGMAGMLALAEYFAAVPKSDRRRTLVFAMTPGHHAGDPGIEWVHDNRAMVLTKTALILNCEHFSQTQTYLSGASLMASNTVSARRWYVGGSDALLRLATKTFRDFGVALYSKPEARPGGELSHVYTDAPSVHIIDHIYYHTDMDVPELVPEAGLENSVRAYAKIIDEVNKLDISALRSRQSPAVSSR